jgi:outer membrane usher protein FimD/PapC
MQEQHEASITIVYANGKVVAPASTAIAEGKTYLIGYDGLLYLPDLQDTKELEIHDGGIVCRVRVSSKDRRATCS